MATKRGKRSSKALKTAKVGPIAQSVDAARERAAPPITIHPRREASRKSGTR